MKTVLETQIYHLLQSYSDPYLKQDFVTAKAIKAIQINDNSVIVDVVLGYPVAGYVDELQLALEKLITTLPEISQATVNISWQIAAHQTQSALPAVPGVKNIIAIASGKGGVGKSTTAVNLALALHLEGAKVGILDADIYGPNQPHMLGVTGQPVVKNEKGLLPIERYGVQSISIGYLIDVNTPMIWRGPMVSQALQQLVRETCWDNLDYLIIDMPPGTGDIQLTLAQKVPVAAAIIVTTPQDIALLDARKGLEMFRKVNIPVLGIIENMSTHICSQCGHEEAIFGSKGAQHMAEKTDVELLGALPLDIRIREQADQGMPIVIAEPESKLAALYRDIGRRIVAKLSLQEKNYAAKFPKIIVENK